MKLRPFHLYTSSGLILIWLLLPLVCLCQKLDFSYTQYDKSDGLPSNTIYSIVDDQDGVMWIGTDAGLCKFDGSNYKVFTTSDGLPSNDIFHLECDFRNRIWIASMSQSLSYIENGKVHNNLNDTMLAEMKFGYAMSSFFTRKDGALVILNSMTGLFLVDTNNSLVICELALPGQTPKNGKTKQWNDSTYHFNLNEIGIIPTNITIGYKWNSKKKAVREMKIFDNKIYYYDNVSKALIQSNKNETKTSDFQISGIGNFIFQNNTNQILNIRNTGVLVYDKNNFGAPIANYLPEYPILFYHQDKQNRNWLCTRGNGLFMLNSPKNKIYKNSKEEIANVFHSVNVADKYIAIGDNRGAITLLNRNTSTSKFTVKFPNETSVPIRVLKVAPYKNKFLVATDGGCFMYDPEQKKTNLIFGNTSCKNLFVIGDTLLLLNGGGLFIYNLVNKYFEQITLNRLYSYHEFNHKIFFGSEYGIYNFVENEFVRYQLNDPFNFRTMDILHFDSTLVFVTINNGLYFVKNDTIAYKLTTQNGLSSNTCFKAITYKNSIYIASNNGINIYNIENKSVQQIFESDGLASNTVNDMVIVNDTIYAATENGCSIIPIANIKPPQKNVLFCKQAIIGKDTLLESKKLYTSHTDIPFSLNLTSLTYGVKGKVSYNYRYSNTDTNFITTSDNIIPLSFPRPGSYTFVAYAIDNNNRLSNTIEIKIDVLPYYWQTLNFKLLMTFLGLILMLGMAYSIRKFAIKREMEKRILDKKLHQLELQAWQSKINPHFLFNSLNSLTSLIQTDRSEKAMDFIFSFSKILRNTIQHSAKLVHTVESEIALIEQYMKFELLKGNRIFEYKITYDSNDVLKQYIPTLLLQPVIENSIKHAHWISGEGLITIHFTNGNEKLTVTLTDNGKSDSAKIQKQVQHQSLGLQLIKDKINIIEKALKIKIYFSFAPNDEIMQHGAKTIFIFPIIKNDL